MPDNGKPLGQQYYEAVEALKAEGIGNAEAVRQVARQYGKQENAVRGGIHQYKSRHLSDRASSRRGRRTSVTSVDDYLAHARQALEEALALVDREVAEAKADLDAAQARYDEVVASVGERKADITRRLEALS
jgi:predicted  nucleic acid-binding Zn-ribbon protein